MANGRRTLDKDGCEFGRELNIKFKNMEEKLDNILENQKEIFNHQSTWSNPEAVKEMKRQNKLITILTGILSATIGAVVGALISIS